MYTATDTAITKDRLAALESANCKLVTTETEQSATIGKLRKQIEHTQQTDEVLESTKKSLIYKEFLILFN